MIALLFSQHQLVLTLRIFNIGPWRQWNHYFWGNFFGRLIWHCSKYYILHFLQDFVIGLSILVRGTLEEKVRWMFTLYDQDRDGYISRYENKNKVATTTSPLQYQISVYNFQLNPDLSFQKVILKSYSKVILE